MRWEFELAALDTEKPEVRELATQLGVDAGKAHPPALVVLNDDGRAAAVLPLRLNGQSKLDARPLSEFLAAHKLATRDAEQMLAEALRKAKAEDKRVFFIASASWCGPCRMLARFLATHKPALERHYVFIKLDISRDAHGNALFDRYRSDRDGGVPWCAILDADGKLLITSNAPETFSYGGTNIGHPSEPPAIQHFLKMLRDTAPNLSKDQLEVLRKALERKG